MPFESLPGLIIVGLTQLIAHWCKPQMPTHVSDDPGWDALRWYFIHSLMGPLMSGVAFFLYAIMVELLYPYLTGSSSQTADA